MLKLSAQASPEVTPEQTGSEEGDGPEEELPGLLDPLPALEGRDDELEPDADFLDMDLEATPRERLGTDENDALDMVQDGSELDPSDLSPMPEESSARSDEEELGVGELGSDWLTEDPGGSALDDETEGLEETELLNSELPQLQPEDDTELPVTGGELPLSTAFADEPRPPRAKIPWAELELAAQLESCGALATAEGAVVAASSDLLWFSSGELTPVRLEAGSSSVHALSLLGSSWDLAICATQNGRLFRRGRLLPASEGLRGVRESGDASARQTLDLCQPGPGFPHALIVRTQRGRLYRSDDDGTTFRAISTPKVVAIAARGALALAPGLLLHSLDAGGSFEERTLSGLAREISLAPSPIIAGCKNVVALAEPTLGVLISTDSGQSFQRVPGTSHVTALTVGEQAGELSVFAASYDGARDQSALLRIFAGARRAEELARLRQALETDDESDMTHVTALVWDLVNQRLWAAGGFGVRAFQAPDT